MSRRDARDSPVLAYGAVPRALLMPPEVALRRKEAGRRRGLVVAVVAVVMLVAAGIGASFWYAAQAETRLAAERALTDELLATQLQFAEVIQVRAQLGSIRDVRDRLGETEVLWLPIVTPYLDVLTEDEILDAITVTGTDPVGPALGLADPLRYPRIATMTMAVETAGVPSPQRWVRAWESLDTFADASIDSIVARSGVFLTIVTINLDRTALSARFSETEDEG